MMATFVDYIESANEQAVAVADDAEQLTYGELRHFARQIASILQSQSGTRKYIMLRATPDVWFASTLLGIIYSGNTPIPVEPALPAKALRFLKTKSQAVTVLNPLRPSEFRDEIPTYNVDDSMPALIIFTSGTAGFPKGVIISHTNLVHSCTTMCDYLCYKKYNSAAVVLPLHYSYALLSQVCCQLLVGGFVRLFSDFKNPIKFSHIVNEANLETFCGVPSTYNALVMVHRLSPLCMPTVKVLCSAGAAMDKSKFDEIKEIFPNATFFNNYGMTEAAPRIAYIREDDPHFFEPTCGRPMDGVEVKIVDPETHEDLPDGQQGMLIVRGPNVTSGYLNDRKITNEAFTNEGYLISGDIAYMNKGYIFICGRHDDIFNVGGEKVAPLEIERVLNRIRSVEDSAVIGIPDEYRGNVPVAFLKLKRSISRKAILLELQEELPEAKIPQRFFEVKVFPMTSNGKLQRRRLSIDDSTYVIGELY